MDKKDTMADIRYVLTPEEIFEGLQFDGVEEMVGFGHIGVKKMTDSFRVWNANESDYLDFEEYPLEARMDIAKGIANILAASLIHTKGLTEAIRVQKIKRLFSQMEILANTELKTVEAIDDELGGVPLIKGAFDEAQSAIGRLIDTVTKHNTENYGR